MVYIAVVADSVTAEYFTFLAESGDLEMDDPPPICVAPSTGRFEVKEACVDSSVWYGAVSAAVCIQYSLIQRIICTVCSAQ